MFRLVTYNVRHCLGTDGILSSDRIAEVLAECRPHIIALQELDVSRARSGGLDQAVAIAESLRMQMHFNAALSVKGEQYGDAILTLAPSTLVRAGALPTLATRKDLEPRGALWVSTRMGGSPIDIINTHLGLRSRERLLQVDALLGPDWIGASRRPLMLVGDFNAVPRSGAYRRLAARLRDVQGLAHGRPRATFPSGLPMLRIDHVFVNAGIDVLRVDTLRSPLARVASDHLPLLVEFRLSGPSAVAPSAAAR